MTIELLYFDDCPNHEAFLPRLRELLEAEGVDREIELRRIESAEHAERERFLGSPSVRVDGRDIEPHAEARDDFGLKCRLYRAEGGLTGTPPDEYVIAALREQPRSSRVGQDDGAAASALGAIGLAPGLLADNRAAGLAPEDRRLYRAILSTLSIGERPSRARLSEDADTDRVEDQLARLEGADLVGLDGDGEVALAYPISVAPTRHRVDLVDGRELWACCAIDALGIPAMLGVDGTVVAQDPDRETEIRVQVPATGDPSAEPEDAVVLAGSAGTGTTACCACPFINFFPSAEAAARYEREHRGLRATQLTIAQATEAGRRLFGEVLGSLAD